MTVVESVENVLVTLQHIKNSMSIQEQQTATLPIISAPQWWIDGITMLAAEQCPSDQVPDGFEIHGCPVVLSAVLPEPVMITHDGKVYPVLPEWQRTDSKRAVTTESISQ